MLVTAFLSYVAGLLTALAPCVLPLLPIILGGSFDASDKDKRRPYIITASLVVSLILFTILLKATTVFIDIDPRVWAVGAGILIIILGIFMLVPNLWAKIIAKAGIEHRSQSLLSKAFKTKNKNVSAILTGAALGPVFSSCSPTYAWVIATVLPANIGAGLIYLTIYILGVATSLLAIALLGRKLLAKIGWASNPKGWFQRIIAILFILVGIFVATGWDKKVQTYLVDKDLFNLISLEQKLVPEGDEVNNKQSGDSSKVNYGIEPYKAPEIKGINDWINSEPLQISGLKGKVVLIDFWTYSCINCQRTQPYLNAWYDKYEKDGLVIIGVHAPEFQFEKVKSNVEGAVQQAGIKYPVAMDNDFATWQAYNNRYWPAKYLIDKDGEVRYEHFGEGEYQKTEEVIQKLLKETGKAVSSGLEKESTDVLGNRGQTPETYLGYERAQQFSNIEQFVADKPSEYTLKNNLQEHFWSLGGKWQMNGENIVSKDGTNQLAINFSAKEVYLVMNGPKGSKVSLDSENIDAIRGQDVDTNNQIAINGARLYKLIKADKFLKNQRLVINIPAGVTLNAFTFGS